MRAGVFYTIQPKNRPWRIKKQGWVTEEEEVRKNTQPRCSSILQTSKSFASKKSPNKKTHILQKNSLRTTQF